MANQVANKEDAPLAISNDDLLAFAGQGVEDLKGKNTDLHTGIYLPPMSAEDVTQAINLAKENGAKGISFFDGNALTKEQLKAIKEASK